MNPEDLQPASYRGVPFLVTSTTTAGGRKTSRKQFVSSDLQVIEDLGLQQREFTVSGVVSARRSNDGRVLRSYLQVRDELLDALEAGGPGILEHPFFGRIPNVVALTYSISESLTQLGDSPISITFAISNTDGRPQAQESVLASVITQADASVAAATTNVSENFEVTESFTGNFTAAIDEVQSFVDKIRAASNVAAAIEEEIDPYNDRIDQFEDDIASLVDTPSELADETQEIIDSTNDLYEKQVNTFNTYVRLFDFGDDQTRLNDTTAGLTERKENNDIYNTAVQNMALSRAYENGVQLDFSTTEDIDETADVLETQYQKMVDSGLLSTEEEEELTKLRIQATDFFNAQRVTAPQIITVKTNPTTTRLLAYQYYGSSDLGDDIADLNELNDSAFISGEVRVLSR